MPGMVGDVEKPMGNLRWVISGKQACHGGITLIMPVSVVPTRAQSPVNFKFLRNQPRSVYCAESAG